MNRTGRLYSMVGLLLIAMTSACMAAFAANEIAPGVRLLHSASKYGSANIGWVNEGDRVVLIGAPHVDLVNKALAEIQATIGKPVRKAILTETRPGELAVVNLLKSKSIEVIAPVANGANAAIESGPIPIEVIQMGQGAGSQEAIVWLPSMRILFTGEIAINGPHVAIAGTNLPLWLKALDQIRRMNASVVVPGCGFEGSNEIIARQYDFMSAAKNMVAYVIVEGRGQAAAVQEFSMLHTFEGWYPYDKPTADDVSAIYSQLTVPQAPFALEPFAPDDARPRALVLLGDRCHSPEFLEPGLRKALESAGVDARFTVDMRALSAENLTKVQLLVILRDGTAYPTPSSPVTTWMTLAQEQAVSDFVQNGGGFLALHNSTGLYPPNGPYLHTLGGTYNSHGPLEWFAVHVTDKAHPITQGVSEFEAPDEQHTPIPDASVHLILESVSEDGVKGAAGWVREQGTGRVCYLANGHTREVLAHPMYQLLLKNAASWCLKKTSPPTAAKSWSILSKKNNGR